MQTLQRARSFATIVTRQLLALLALLAVLVPALAACGAEDLSPSAIAEAADTTAAERGMRIAITQTLTIPRAGRVLASGSGVMDPARQVSHITLKVTSGPDRVVGAFDQAGLLTEVITDRFTVYTHSPQLNQLLGHRRTWVKVDADRIGRAAGVDVSALTQPGQDPTQALRQLAAVSGDVETVGDEEVRGVATTRYSATVDLRRYPDLVSRADRAAARASIDDLIEQSGASEIPVDVWLGEDGLVRRLAQRLALNVPGGPSAIEQRFDLYDFGTKVYIDVPDASEVSDQTNLVDGRGATVGP